LHCRAARLTLIRCVLAYQPTAFQPGIA